MKWVPPFTGRVEGTSPARTIFKANILLASSRSSKKHMTVAEIADVYHTTPACKKK
jgi:hypothetical protein